MSDPWNFMKNLWNTHKKSWNIHDGFHKKIIKLAPQGCKFAANLHQTGTPSFVLFILFFILCFFFMFFHLGLSQNSGAPSLVFWAKKEMFGAPMDTPILRHHHFFTCYPTMFCFFQKWKIKMNYIHVMCYLILWLSYGISRQHMWLQQYVTIFWNTMYYLVATALFSKPNSAHVFSTCEWKMPPWQLPTHAPSSMFYKKKYLFVAHWAKVSPG